MIKQDIALIVYLIILASLLINILYMIYWAIAYKKVSVMFAWVAVLFISMFLRYLLTFYVRIKGPDWYNLICHSWWWEVKDVPVAVASLAVCFVFTHRFTGGKGVQ